MAKAKHAAKNAGTLRKARSRSPAGKAAGAHRVRSWPSFTPGFRIHTLPSGDRPQFYAITGSKGVPYKVKTSLKRPRAKRERVRFAQRVLDSTSLRQPTTSNPDEVDAGYRKFTISKKGIEAEIHPEMWQDVRRAHKGLPFDRGTHSRLRRIGRLAGQMPNLVGAGTLIVIGKGSKKVTLIPLRSRKMEFTEAHTST